MDKFYLTTPIYYASGKPHLGHAFTTIYADVIARFKRGQNEKVFFSTGMDEHGAKIADKAESENKNPKKFVDEVAKDYLEMWNSLGISYDGFIRTTSESHVEGLKEFVRRINDSGDLYQSEYEGLYCVGCETFLTPKSLINGLCPDHLIEPQRLKEKNYFFNLKKYLPTVKEKILSGELKIEPESRRHEILKMIDSDLPDFSFTRENVKWGIPFPYDESQTIYVWADALANYLTVLDFPDGENFKEFWPTDLHLIGAEINKFHSIYWPAMLISAGLPLPKEIFVHGLFTVNGQKMSKTLGNIIDPIKISEKIGVDAFRYLVLSQFPASEHGDIKESEFYSKYGSDLTNGVGNLFERVAAMVVGYKNLEGILKSQSIDKKLKAEIDLAEKEYFEFMDGYRLFEVLRAVMKLAREVDQYINAEKPWSLPEGERKEEVLNSLLSVVEIIIGYLAPFMPEKMAIAADYFKKIEKGEAIKAGEREKLNLFPRIG
jgi:methionyl-tRNA synthetase